MKFQAGAICVSLGIDPWNVYMGNLGALMYAIWALRAKDWNIFIVNMTFLIIYGYGIWARLF
jgi:hypothetical protein